MEANIFLWGFVGILQAVLLPGLSLTACLKNWNWPQRILLAPPLSILINYYAVCLLVWAGAYHRPVMLAIVGLEIAWILYRTRSKTAAPKYLPITRVAELLFLTLAITAITKYAQAWVRDFGSVFEMWDAIVSWNAWAREWFHGNLPLSGLYPHSIAISLSLPYVLLGQTEIETFSKATMGIVFLLGLGSLIELGFRRKEVRLLAWAMAFAYPAIQAKFLQSHWNSGYADVPLALTLLFAFSASFFDGREAPWIFGLISGTAPLVKQPGLLFAGISPLLTKPESWKATKQALLPTAVSAAIAGGPWYLFIFNRIYLQNRDSNNVGFLAGLVGGDFFDRWAVTVKLVLYFAGPWALATYVLLTVLGNITSPIARRWFLLLGLPYFLIWGTFFSYDIRNLSMALFPLSIAVVAGIVYLVKKAEAQLPAVDLSIRIPRLMTPSFLGWLVPILCLVLCLVSLRRPIGHWRTEGSVISWEQKQRALLGDAPAANGFFRRLTECHPNLTFLTNYSWATVVYGIKEKVRVISCEEVKQAIAGKEKALVYFLSTGCDLGGMAPAALFKQGQTQIFSADPGFKLHCPE